ncbi:MAG TPA: 16S rRNA (uracil(1498)-N(3))-methyltransferase [Candidatus Acetatifactor stercoripullorum]|uniref:Ribosomal RNA small subunit methyltransferase E n=1 Tax=Candidatus Acetatifactor stercoripullorum TaxID=2838414 RepID=A0A9D1U9S2_9FIRM|nr:16S rRNA (uracil(1498)-N(3))-methyltransferase [uncultured Acetatifactor sp.]HIW79964.1 16S rRNA (uracil(1498)-N(3))-methyltransferase [Candidatus Acetatifactor stercoripullorum]
MYQFFVEPGQIDVENRRVVIEGGDVNHIKNVLRMKVGEEIAVNNGQDGREYRCGIVSLHEDRIICQLRFIKEDSVELPVKVYLFQGLPKGDKMELVIQKAVELGAHAVIPVAAKRCVVRLDEKKARAKVLRWQGIAQAAAKQSRRGIIPAVSEVMSFEGAVKLASSMDVKLIPYELAQDMDKTRQLIESLKPGQSAAVFIGPEGGFEEQEVELAKEAGIVPVTLGKRILRTETAGLAVMAWIMYQCQ